MQLQSVHSETTVEAGSVEEALELVIDELGPDAEIVSASKEARGGVAGFFAREVIVLQARSRPVLEVADEDDVEVVERPELPGDAPSRYLSPPPFSAPPPSLGPSRSLDQILNAMVADAEGWERSFSEHLLDEMSSSATRTPATPPGAGSLPSSDDATDAAPAPTARTTTDVGAAPAAAIRVSERRQGRLDRARALAAAGAPVSVVQALVDCGSDDEGRCLLAVAEVVQPLIGDRPEGPQALVGEGATRIAPLVDVPSPAAFASRSRSPLSPRADLGGSVCVPVGGGQGALIAAADEDRWAHVVVGGKGWEDLLAIGPKAISWTEPADTARAIAAAEESGAVLAIGPTNDPVADLTLVEALDVAILLRSIWRSHA